METKDVRDTHQMSFYADSDYPVRQDLTDIHESQMSQLSEPGTWGSSAQRIAIATEARRAAYDVGQLEAPEGGDPEPEVPLPEVAKAVVRKLAVSPKDFLEDSYQEARDGGLSDEEYVEIVGIVSRMVDLDIFARGIGVPLRPLPSPGPGEPSRARPETAKQELAFVPTIPNPPEGGAEAADLYGEHPMPYIVRGMSLVPDELRRHVELEQVQYLPLPNIRIPDYQQHEGFSRSQVEIVAARVSALNECFY